MQFIFFLCSIRVATLKEKRSPRLWQAGAGRKPQEAGPLLLPIPGGAGPGAVPGCLPAVANCQKSLSDLQGPPRSPRHSSFLSPNSCTFSRIREAPQGLCLTPASHTLRPQHTPSWSSNKALRNSKFSLPVFQFQQKGSNMKSML